MSDIDPLGRADASEATRAANESLAGRLPFGDTRDFEEAERGLLAPLPDGSRVRQAALQDLVANRKANVDGDAQALHDRPSCSTSSSAGSTS